MGERLYRVTLSVDLLMAAESEAEAERKARRVLEYDRPEVEIEEASASTISVGDASGLRPDERGTCPWGGEPGRKAESYLEASRG